MTVTTDTVEVEDVAQEQAQTLVSAARRLFVQKGYRQTSYEEIAAAADLHIGPARALYPDKQAVFAALVHRTVLVSGLLAGDIAQGIDEDLPVRLARTYLTLWEPNGDEESPMVELYRIALADQEASRVLARTVSSRLNGQVDRELPGPDAGLRTAGFGAHLGGTAIARHLLGVEPLAGASLDEVLRIIGPALRSELLGAQD